jgi:hypothetical protein
MGGLVWFDKIFQACQGPTSFMAYMYERGWVIFEYSHVFRSGGALMQSAKLLFEIKLVQSPQRSYVQLPLFIKKVKWRMKE